MGNHAATGVALAAATGGVLTLADQSIEIDNEGEAEADSGDNEAVGNESENEADTDQETELDADDLDAGDLVSSTSRRRSTNPTARASVRTGAATAVGNRSAVSACTGLNTDVDCPEVALPPLECPCHKDDDEEAEPPVAVPVATRCRLPHEGHVHVDELPVTGMSTAGLALLGLGLIVVGRMLRRSRATA